MVVRPVEGTDRPEEEEEEAWLELAAPSGVPSDSSSVKRKRKLVIATLLKREIR